MKFRIYLAGTIFFILLVWGPINHSMPAWFIVRIGYLILIPFLVSLITGWAFNYWQITEKIEILLERILSGIICLGLLIFAFLEATAKKHIGNTQSIQTRDGIEDVGEDIIIDGPDWGIVFVYLIFAGVAFWVGVLQKGNNTSIGKR